MKLKNAIFSVFSVAALCSCSAVYEDLDPCPQGAAVNLTFTKNMQYLDRYGEEVHCATVLIYDSQSRFVGEFPVADGSNNVKIDLPKGDYHAIAYGGMSCVDSNHEFNFDINDPHSYNDLLVYLQGTRAAESSTKLHGHFHGVGNFTVTDDDLTHVPVVIDLVKNTNLISLDLAYSDASPVQKSDFTVTLTADNAVMNHDNSVAKQNQDIIYRPFAETVGTSTTIINGLTAPVLSSEISTCRLTPDSNATLHIADAAGQEVLTIPLISYIRKMNFDGSLEDYLDRQDSWHFEFVLDPATDKMAGLSFTINGWTVIINEFDI